jgi:hypothetical protein
MNIQIANPIYDIVFKYMMEDNEVAKLLLSSIIGSEVTYLDPRPQEYTETEVVNPLGLYVKVYRLDFAARIETADGSKLVLIEIQKATDFGDVMRFRKYLGEQYSNPNNVVKIKTENKEYKGKEEETIALPIYTLYFLDTDAGIDNVPVVEVNRELRDVATGKIITDRSHFIESLYHRGWIVQVKHLKEPRRTELEQLLSIFDQSKYTTNIHFSNINEKEIPKKFHPLIRRLKKAASIPEIQKKMENEDLIANQMRNYILKETRELRYKLAEKEEELAEKDNALAKKDNTITEQDKENAELRRLLQQAGIDIQTKKK